MIIYKVTNRINGKVYIGQTKRSLQVRWKQHCSPYSNCRALHRAIEKYGAENFTVEQIDVACSSDELNAKERYWIEHYKSVVPNGYNLCAGGTAYEKSLETRKKHSASMTEHITSKETKEKISKALMGHSVDEITRKKMSECKKKPVMCIDTGIVYDCAMTAEKSLGIRHIREVCNGIYKQTKGTHWKYV